VSVLAVMTAMAGVLFPRQRPSQAVRSPLVTECWRGTNMRRSAGQHPRSTRWHISLNQAVWTDRGKYGVAVFPNRLSFESMRDRQPGTGHADGMTEDDWSDIGPDITPRAALTDKGYDSAKNRPACRERIVPIIPFRWSARNKPKFFPKSLYKTRARIEQAMQAKTLRAGRRYAAKRPRKAMPPLSASCAL